MNPFRILLLAFRRNAAATTTASVPLASPLPEARIATDRVPYAGGYVEYAIPNESTQWRVDTLFTKEPDTLEWISTFEPDEVMVDIGANVGMYTIWAAKTRGTRVFAFEPESQNYATLYQNIVLNGLSQRVVAYCCALSDESGFSLLHLGAFKSGSSMHTYGENVDYKLEPRTSKLSQGCISTTLDRLVADGVIPVPNHVKIDVDGLEHRVLAGARGVLADARLKSVLVEINTNLQLHRDIIAEMQALGFSCSAQQIAVAMRTQGVFKGVGNHVFRR